MSKDFDVQQAAKQDVRKVARLERKSLGPGAIIEYVLWFLMMLSILGMLASMYWVGPTRPIPGHVWLGYSLTLILTFGTLALLVKLGRTYMGDVDSSMSRAFDKRGR